MKQSNFVFLAYLLNFEPDHWSYYWPALTLQEIPLRSSRGWYLALIIFDFGSRSAKQNAPLQSLLIPAYIPHVPHFALGSEDPMAENCWFEVGRDVIVLSESSVNLILVYLD